MSKYRTVTLAITLVVMALSMVKSKLEKDHKRSAADYPRKDTLQINQDNLADFDTTIGLKQGADENIKFLSFFKKAREPSSHHTQKACLLNNARCNPMIPCCHVCHNYRNACGDYL